MKGTLRLLVLAVIVLGASVPVRALGPLDVEVTALFWNSDTEVLGVSESSGEVGARAEVWFKRLGASAAYFQPKPEGLLSDLDFEYTNLDVKWKFIAPTENNFFALGAGYQSVDLAGGGFDDDSTGARLVAEGRVGLTGILYFYGRGAYMPELSDIETGTVSLTNGSGFEYEFGLQLKPFPFLQLFGGFRSHKNEYDVPLGTTEFKHDGIVVGGGVNF
jgi:hypothetical protein